MLEIEYQLKLQFRLLSYIYFYLNRVKKKGEKEQITRAR